MARNRLSLKDAETAFFYLQPKFLTREDAEVACDMLQGLCENKPLVIHEKKVTAYGETIAGRFILEVFAIPNRSYHVEDIQAHMEERFHSANTVTSYLPHLVREGYIYKVGVQTYARRHPDASTAAPIRSDVDVDATLYGEPTGLEFSSPCGCGCGDEGHRPEDLGHRGTETG